MVMPFTWPATWDHLTFALVGGAPPLAGAGGARGAGRGAAATRGGAPARPKMEKLTAGEQLSFVCLFVCLAYLFVCCLPSFVDLSSNNFINFTNLKEDFWPTISIDTLSSTEASLEARRQRRKKEGGKLKTFHWIERYFRSKILVQENKFKLLKSRRQIRKKTQTHRSKWEIMFPFFRSTEEAPKDKSSKSRSRSRSRSRS